MIEINRGLSSFNIYGRNFNNIIIYEPSEYDYEMAETNL